MSISSVFDGRMCTCLDHGKNVRKCHCPRHFQPKKPDLGSQKRGATGTTTTCRPFATIKGRQVLRHNTVFMRSSLWEICRVLHLKAADSFTKLCGLHYYSLRPVAMPLSRFHSDSWGLVAYQGRTIPNE